MIGPTSTVYHQEYRSDNERDRDPQHYQQWVDAVQRQQLDGIPDLQHGHWQNEGGQHFGFTFHPPYFTAHQSVGYVGDSVDSAGGTNETGVVNGVEYGGLENQQPHNVGHFPSEFYSDPQASSVPNSATANVTYPRTTFAPISYPVNIEDSGQQHAAMYHQEQAQHPSYVFNQISSYSELVGSAAGNGASSSLTDQNSTSLSKSGSKASLATENYRILITKRAYQGTERLEPDFGLSPDSDTVSNNVTELAAPLTTGRQGTPTGKANPSSPKRKRRKKDVMSDVVNPETILSESDSEEDSEPEFSGGISVGVGGMGVVGRPGKGLRT
ncbi:hypothetical protein AX15_000767 [Amanita polypyramis BW_CC]|nr:hypothetical protein AX15_000767 [Amanita polypyramis BW_CC]